MNSKQAVQLDAIDWRIVEALQADGRASLSSLGKKVGLSQPAVSERVKRLEAHGVIEGYSARINFRAVGLDLLAIARIKTTFANLQACLKLFESMPEILEVHRVTGEDCLIVKVLVPARRAAGIRDRSAGEVRLGDHLDRALFTAAGAHHAPHHT